MSLYTSIEKIKNFFTPRYTAFNPNAAQDAQILSQISSRAVYMRARNGATYFYFFPIDEAYLDVAKFLMVRNGLKPRKHRSFYPYIPVTVLRVLDSDINSSPARSEFVQSIKPAGVPHKVDFFKNVRAVREQMRAKTR